MIRVLKISNQLSPAVAAGSQEAEDQEEPAKLALKILVVTVDII
jgi:hypothetical protein